MEHPLSGALRVPLSPSRAPAGLLSPGLLHLPLPHGLPTLPAPGLLAGEPLNSAPTTSASLVSTSPAQAPGTDQPACWDSSRYSRLAVWPAPRLVPRRELPTLSCSRQLGLSQAPCLRILSTLPKHSQRLALPRQPRPPCLRTHLSPWAASCPECSPLCHLSLETTSSTESSQIATVKCHGSRFGPLNPFVPR